MNSVVLILLLTAAAIILISKIPGLEHLTRPIIELIVTAIKVTFATLGAWGVYVFKTMWSAHAEVANHLVNTASEIDPSHALRNK